MKSRQEENERWKKLAKSSKVPIVTATQLKPSIKRISKRVPTTNTPSIPIIDYLDLLGQ